MRNHTSFVAWKNRCDELEIDSQVMMLNCTSKWLDFGSLTDLQIWFCFIYIFLYIYHGNLRGRGSKRKIIFQAVGMFQFQSRTAASFGYFPRYIFAMISRLNLRIFLEKRSGTEIVNISTVTGVMKYSQPINNVLLQGKFLKIIMIQKMRGI